MYPHIYTEQGGLSRDRQLENMNLGKFVEVESCFPVWNKDNLASKYFIQSNQYTKLSKIISTFQYKVYICMFVTFLDCRLKCTDFFLQFYRTCMSKTQKRNYLSSNSGLLYYMHTSKVTVMPTCSHFCYYFCYCMTFTTCHTLIQK